MLPILRVLLPASGLTDVENLAPKLVLLTNLLDKLLQTPKKIGL